MDLWDRLLDSTEFWAALIGALVGAVAGGLTSGLATLGGAVMVEK